MIGENYKCDGQMSMTDITGKLKQGECNHGFILMRTKKLKYYKCVKCGKRCRYGKKMFGVR